MAKWGVNEVKPTQRAGTMEFFDEFCWPVPKAFSDALAACCFEAGDVLYSSKGAYEPWFQRSLKGDWGLQVTYPARSSGSRSTGNPESIFDRNWGSAVEFTLINLGNNQAESANINQKIKTTQGSLYNLLRYGDLPQLKGYVQPPLPLLLDELKKTISSLEVMERVKSLIKEKAPGTTAGVMAYDETDSVSVDKYLLILAALQGVTFSIFDFHTGEFPSLAKLDFLPTASVRVLAIPSDKVQACRASLIAALWPRRDAKSATKSFCDVVKRSRSVSANSFKLSNHILLSIPVENQGLSQNASNIPKSLRNFLDRTKEDLPQHLFTSENLSVANVDLDVVAKTTKELDDPSASTRNSDLSVLAVDLPVWLESEELKDYQDTFGSTETLTSKIDILRLESDGSIGVWINSTGKFDHKDLIKMVFLQVVMLAARTGLKLSIFKCGIITETETFGYNPHLAQVEPCSMGQLGDGDQLLFG